MNIQIVKNKKATNVDGLYMYTVEVEFTTEENHENFSEIYLIPAGKYMLPDESVFDLDAIVAQKSEVFNIDKSDIDVKILEV